MRTSKPLFALLLLQTGALLIFGWLLVADLVKRL